MAYRRNTKTGGTFRVKNVLEFTGEPIRPRYLLNAREREVLDYIESGEAENEEQLYELLQYDTSKEVARLMKLGLVEEIQK